MGGLDGAGCVGRSEQCQAHNRSYLPELLTGCDMRGWPWGWHELSSRLVPCPCTTPEETSFGATVLACTPLLLHLSICVCRRPGGLLPPTVCILSAEGPRPSLPGETHFVFPEARPAIHHCLPDAPLKVSVLRLRKLSPCRSVRMTKSRAILGEEQKEGQVAGSQMRGVPARAKGRWGDSEKVPTGPVAQADRSPQAQQRLAPWFTQRLLLSTYCALRAACWRCAED